PRPPPPPARVAAEPPPRHAAPAWTHPRRAPEAGPAGAPAATLDGAAALHHPPLARALEHAGLAGRYDVVLPRTGDELRAWGRLLDNCLGSFAAAVASGTTIVAGVREQGLLVAALEVRDGRLVQLLAARNRPPERPLTDAVVPHVVGRLRSA
ncbi:MAG TPA: PcfJ domain-containing protein, partial [Acidimicrobiales bacterium]|nr:PcfJ domain-containing protein [Acidimicrobiales bacterium]